MKDNESLRDTNEQHWCKILDIVADLKGRKLQWLGHTIRMVNKPRGWNKVGRPKMRWLETVEMDLRALKVGTWKRKAQY